MNLWDSVVRWVFAPTLAVSANLAIAPWPFLWLGCWTAWIAATLDTPTEYPSST